MTNEIQRVAPEGIDSRVEQTPDSARGYTSGERNLIHRGAFYGALASAAAFFAIIPSMINDEVQRGNPHAYEQMALYGGLNTIGAGLFGAFIGGHVGRYLANRRSQARGAGKDPDGRNTLNFLSSNYPSENSLDQQAIDGIGG